jgi:SAM-dependent methyltransferase
MRLARLRRHWNELGRRDPLWAILTAPDKKGNKWSVDEFLRTGRDEIAALMAHLERLPVTVSRRRALDFGCGVGRLTRALADYFEDVIGVDIAASMVDAARQLHRDVDRCRFVVNETDSLATCAPESVDLVYTRLVLQHIHPRYIRKYLAEFMRVLAPGGVLVFQLPEAYQPPVGGSGVKTLVPLPLVAVIRWVRGLAGPFPRMELHGLSRHEVEALLSGLGGTIVDVVDDRSHGVDTPGYRYYVTKRPG